jgi:hypothetical protein
MARIRCAVRNDFRIEIKTFQKMIIHAFKHLMSISLASGVPVFPEALCKITKIDLIY